MGKPVKPPGPWLPHARGAAPGTRGLRPGGPPSAPPPAVQGASPPWNPGRSRPRQDDGGLGRRPGNGVISSHRASAQMAAWTRAGRRLAWEARWGWQPRLLPGPRAAKAAPRCQGPARRSRSRHGFLIGGFPWGSLATCPSKVFGDRENQQTPSHPALPSLQATLPAFWGVPGGGSARGPGKCWERPAFSLPRPPFHPSGRSRDQGRNGAGC